MPRCDRSNRYLPSDPRMTGRSWRVFSDWKWERTEASEPRSTSSRLGWARFRQLFQDEYLAGLRERTRENYNTVLDVFEDIVNPDRLRSASRQAGPRPRRRNSFATSPG